MTALAFRGLTFALGLVGTVALSAPGSKSIELAIGAGKVEEICIKLPQGAVVRWQFEADAALDFNLHQHVGKDVLMPLDQRGVRKSSGEHRVDRANDWCLMWTAPKTQAVKVRGRWSHEAPR